MYLFIVFTKFNLYLPYSSISLGSTEEPAPSGSPTATEQPAAVIPAGESLIGDLLSIDLNAPPAAAPPPPAAPSAAVDLLGGGLDTLVSIFISEWYMKI